MKWRDWLFFPNDAADPITVTRVQLVSPNPGQSRLACAWSLAKRLYVAVAKAFAAVVASYAFLLFLSPWLYNKSVTILPHAYYKIGDFSNPPRFDSIKPWNVDLSAIDSSPKKAWLTNLLRPETQIGRLGKDKSIPGRNNPRIAAGELAGKTWEAKQCLFIKDFMFITARLSNDGPGGVEVAVPIRLQQSEPNTGHASVLAIKASELRTARDFFPKDKDEDYTARFFEAVREALPPDVPKGECTRHAAGQLCPRVQIWAYGVPAPCSIWPF